jgi:hypothetical protein
VNGPPFHVVLVHSPLVGPATLAPVAAALRSLGHRATVRALTPPLHAPRPWWRSAAAQVVAAVAADDPDRDGADTADGVDRSVTAGGPVVLVGHSGAGLALPAIGAALGVAGRPVAVTCFVDALLPADGRRPLDGAPPAFAALVADLAVDGLLPPWSQWFGDEAMAAAVPDPAARAAVVEELVPVPTTYFDDPVPVPAGWPAGGCAYLSFTYEPELAEARALGWPTAVLDGGHLHTVVDPSAVAAAVVDLAVRAAPTL